MQFYSYRFFYSFISLFFSSIYLFIYPSYGIGYDILVTCKLWACLGRRFSCDYSETLDVPPVTYWTHWFGLVWKRSGVQYCREICPKFEKVLKNSDFFAFQKRVIFVFSSRVNPKTTRILKSALNTWSK